MKKDNLINDIKLYYKHIIDIRNSSEDLLSTASLNLLENSLHLSVFTLFEEFIKMTIKNFIILKKDNLFIKEISDSMLTEYFNTFDKKSWNIAKFEKEVEMFNNPLNENMLSSIYKFKFFHKNVIENYYRYLFKDILGKENFLEKLELITRSYMGDVEIIEKNNAKVFLTTYISEIRNNIAHRNYSFKAKSHFNLDLETVVKYLFQIITSIYESYKEYNKSEIIYLDNKKFEINSSLINDLEINF